jgi:hypothetical protein
MTVPNLLEMPVDELVDYAPRELMGEDFPLNWSMTRAERMCFIHLLRVFSPELSLEIGTAQGGSLHALSKHSKSVISLDIDPNVGSSLGSRFPNARFLTGNSAVVLPNLVEELNASERQVSFVLIDGDHSEQGVRSDINAVLGLKPRRPICIVMHDSFHPPCRAGMRTANWAQCPYVHYIELDFVSGGFFPGNPSVDTSMWGGFAVALMLPTLREFGLPVLESQQQSFEIVRTHASLTGHVALPPGD